jgi:hypothetical protein
MSIKSLVIVVALALQSVRAAVPVNGQCGVCLHFLVSIWKVSLFWTFQGIGYTGDTTCASGSTCVVSDECQYFVCTFPDTLLSVTCKLQAIPNACQTMLLLPIMLTVVALAVILVPLLAPSTTL